MALTESPTASDLWNATSKFRTATIFEVVDILSLERIAVESSCLACAPLAPSKHQDCFLECPGNWSVGEKVACKYSWTFRRRGVPEKAVGGDILNLLSSRSANFQFSTVQCREVEQNSKLMRVSQWVRFQLNVSTMLWQVAFLWSNVWTENCSQKHKCLRTVGQ
jgi:hypothetical protein